MTKQDLEDEVKNFTYLASLDLPRPQNIPKIDGIDYFMQIEPLKGCVGGDHGIIVNFDDYLLEDRIKQAWQENRTEFARKLEKNRNVVGILIADVSGKKTTDHSIALYLDALFRMTVAYNLKYDAEVTVEGIELMNTMVYNLLNVSYLPEKKFVSMLIGEFSGSGRFRYIIAGHPVPKIYSREFDGIANYDNGYIHSSTPLGMQPSKYVADVKHFEPIGNRKERYTVNEVNLLGKGDIMVLYTDGLSEQRGGELNFVRDKLEDVLREAKDESAKGIYTAIRVALQKYSPPDDDVTIAVVKKV